MNSYRDEAKLIKYLNIYHLENVINNDMRKQHVFHAFSKGELVCRLGDSIGYFYILLEGQVKIYTTSSDGKTLSLRIMEPLTNFGDIELMTRTRYRCNVEALSQTLCLAFPMEITATQGLNHNAFLRYLCKDLCHKFDDITSTSSNNILYPLRNRLVSYMLDYLCEDTNTIVFPFSHKELAELLGITYRHLTRSLSELEKHDLIKIGDGILYVKNELGLRKLDVDVYPHKV